MEIGLSTATFFGKELTEDSFEIIRKLGVKTVEVFLTTFSEYEPDFGDLLVKRKGDIKVFSVHSLNLHYEPELFNNVERTRADAEVILRKVLTNGKKLGAKSYTFHGGARLKNKPYIIDFPVFSKKVNGIIDIAAEYDIELSYENVHWAMLNTPEIITELDKWCPKLRHTLDIKQAMQKGIDYRKFVTAMGSRINNVHLSDYNSDGKLLPPHEGIVDYYDLFSHLFDVGYNGPLLVELYSGNYSDYSELGRSLEYLRNILLKIH